MAQDSKPKKDPRSPLRKAFDTVERAVANRAEPLATSGGFAKVLGVYVSVNRGVRGVAGKATGGLLHLVKIPTTGDVGKLHQHLASVDSHIAELIRDKERAAGELSSRDEDPGASAPDPSASSASKPGGRNTAGKSVGTPASGARKTKAATPPRRGADRETSGG